MGWKEAGMRPASLRSVDDNQIYSALSACTGFTFTAVRAGQ